MRSTLFLILSLFYFIYNISPVSDGNKQLTRTKRAKLAKKNPEHSGKEHKEMFNCNRVHQPLRSKGSRWSMEALVPRSCSSSGWSDSAALPSQHIEDFVIWGRWDRTDWCCCVWSVGKISGTSSHLGFYSSCTIFSLGGNKPIKRSIMSVSGFVQS